MDKVTCVFDENVDREIKNQCQSIATYILTFHNGVKSSLCDSHTEYGMEKLGEKFIIKKELI